MPEEQDAELLAAYRGGNVSALEQLVERYRRPLFGYILNMLDLPADADEVFQEVWLRAIRSLDRYKDRNFLSWLFRIAHNVMVDRFRRRKSVVSIDQEDANGKKLAEGLADARARPSTLVRRSDLSAVVGEAVERLPPEQREVFLMRVEAELPFKEIARIQGVSINTALARMQYAIAKLRTMLADEIVGWGKI